MVSNEDFTSLPFYVSIAFKGEDFLEFDFYLLMLISPYIYNLYCYLRNIVSENYEILYISFNLS
jgi:hypothetical protein